MSRDEASCVIAREFIESINHAYGEKTLTPEQLSAAVRFIYDDGDCYTCSPGKTWIWNNPDQFAEYVPDAEMFFRDHLDILAAASIAHPKLFSLIKAERRADYLEFALVTSPSSDLQWVRTACASGVEPNKIDKLIRIMIAKYPNSYPNSFVSHGAGSLPVSWQPQVLQQDTPWAIFNDTELTDVLRSCLPHAAKEMIQHRKVIVLRLGEETANQLCKEAADHLNSIVQLELRDLRLLPLPTRLCLARRIKLENFQPAESTAMFICDMLLDLVEEAGSVLALSNKQEVEFDLMNKIGWAPTLYRAAHSLNREVPRWFAKVLEARLIRDKFVIGTVQIGQHKGPRDTRSRSQNEVHHENVIFVQERRQSDFHPSVGARVIINTKNAQPLSWRDGKQIKTVYFEPTTRLR